MDIACTGGRHAQSGAPPAQGAKSRASFFAAAAKEKRKAQGQMKKGRIIFRPFPFLPPI